MLYWYFRNIQCVIQSFFRSKLKSPTEIVTRTFWANPFDSDWMNSVQAGQFFTYTDAARWELAVRTGFFRLSLKNKWVIILGGQKITYRRPVKLFKRFQITMQFVGWDEKWIYAAHVFRQKGDIKCVSFSKLGLRCKRKLLDPKVAFSKMGIETPNPPPSWAIKHFQQDLETLNTADKELPI